MLTEGFSSRKIGLTLSQGQAAISSSMPKSPNSNVSYMRIGQVAVRSGVSAKALRLYEQRGLLKPCAYSAAGYRLYGPAALRRLMQIVALKRSGFFACRNRRPATGRRVDVRHAARRAHCDPQAAGG